DLTGQLRCGISRSRDILLAPPAIASASPAKAGVHSSTARSAARWVPAFAGNALFMVLPSLPSQFGQRDMRFDRLLFAVRSRSGAAIAQPQTVRPGLLTIADFRLLWTVGLVVFAVRWLEMLVV